MAFIGWMTDLAAMPFLWTIKITNQEELRAERTSMTVAVAVNSSDLSVRCDYNDFNLRPSHSLSIDPSQFSGFLLVNGLWFAINP